MQINQIQDPIQDFSVEEIRVLTKIGTSSFMIDSKSCLEANRPIKICLLQ